MDLRARTDGPLTRGLTLRSVRKRFGPTAALDGASCTVRTGTVHALLGENGAGKTTLMRIAYGMLRADGGSIELDGKPVTFHSSRDAIDAGLGMVHQHFMLVPAMTVAENVALGGKGRYDGKAAAARARSISEEAGLGLDPHARVADLSVGAQQRVEIVKALSHDARLLILDEPTAVLSPREAEELYAWLRRFTHAGGTVVLITHRLREALAVSDDVTVLRRGLTVLEGAAGALPEDAVIEALTGDATGDAVPAARRTRAASSTADTVLALDHVTYVDPSGVRRLDNASLVVRAGEVLGVLGVEGSGQRELLRILAGRLKPTSGSVRIPDAVGFIPEDRMNDALIPAMSLTENLALAGAAQRRGLIDWPALRARTATIIQELRITAAGPDQEASALSGGNQQRFIVGREQHVASRALVAENPTRGLDIRASARVRMAIGGNSDANAPAVVYYSSDIEEVLAVATRVVACHGGRVTEVTAPEDPGDRSAYTRALMGTL